MAVSKYIFIHIACDHCNNTYTSAFQEKGNKYDVIVEARKAGWKIEETGKWAKCPTCAQGGRKLNISVPESTVVASESWMRWLTDGHTPTDIDGNPYIDDEEIHLDFSIPDEKERRKVFCHQLYEKYYGNRN